MSLPSFDTKLCYRGGVLGWVAVQLALAAPAFVWACLSYLASLTCDAYHILLAGNWMLVAALHYLVAVGWNAREGGAPLDACNNNLRAMPDLAVWLLVHYALLAEVHRRLTYAPATWYGLACTLAHLVLPPAVLLWTHNTRPLYALAGAGLGLASGALFCALLLCVLLPALGGLTAARLAAEHDAAQPQLYFQTPPPRSANAQARNV